MAKGYCWGPDCNEEIEIQTCCSGHECGCMGLPAEPPFCSEKCYDAYMEKSRNTPKGSAYVGEERDRI